MDLQAKKNKERDDTSTTSSSKTPVSSALQKIKEELRKAQEENKTLNQMYKNDVKERDVEITTLKELSASLKRKNEEFTMNLKVKEGIIEDLSQETKHLEQQNEYLQSYLSDVDNRIIYLFNELNKAKENMNQTKRDNSIASLQNNMSDTDEHHDCLKSDSEVEKRSNENEVESLENEYENDSCLSLCTQEDISLSSLEA